jgi:hypothetical protein
MRRSARIECKGFLARHNDAFAKKKGDAKDLLDSNIIGTWKCRPTGSEVVDPAHPRVYLDVSRSWYTGPLEDL